MLACRRTLALLAVLTALAAAAGACRSHKQATLPAPGSADADRFLFDRGTELLKKRNWLTAREYFKKLIDTYPQSTLRNDARLGVGDSYLGERRIESYILGVNEFRQFLQFAPLNPKADYAQYKICLGDSKQMLNAERDQTATQEALTDCDAFIKNYPTSQYRTEAERIRRQVRDRLSDHQFAVGLLYYRGHYWLGSEPRFRQVLTEDPGYSRLDQVFFYLAETLYREKRLQEARPYYARLLNEFPKSKLAKNAQKRAAELDLKLKR